jgi:hypothetical protein
MEDSVENISLDVLKEKITTRTQAQEFVQSIGILFLFIEQATIFLHWDVMTASISTNFAPARKT